MADLRTSFVVLEDLSTSAGVPLVRAFEGDAIANRSAHGALVAKDVDQNFKYLEVDPSGALKVSLGADYACLSDSGTNAGNVAYQTIATITLQTGFTYRDIEVLVSSFRDSIFQIIHLDDAAEIVLCDGIRVGAGAYNEMARFECMEFVAGATGTQSLLVKGKNLNALSTMDATISVKEINY